MKVIDIIILVPLLIGAYKGFSKGFLREIVSILALVLAMASAFTLMDQVMNLLREYLPEGKAILPFIAFITVFFGVIVLISWLGKLVKTILDYTLLGSIDDIAGAILGIAKWCFSISIILWLIQQADIIIPDEATDGALIYPYLVQFGPKLIDWSAFILPYAKDLIASISELFYR